MYFQPKVKFVDRKKRKALISDIEQDERVLVISWNNELELLSELIISLTSQYNIYHKLAAKMMLH